MLALFFIPQSNRSWTINGYPTYFHLYYPFCPIYIIMKQHFTQTVCQIYLLTYVLNLHLNPIK